MLSPVFHSTNLNGPVLIGATLYGASTMFRLSKACLGTIGIASEVRTAASGWLRITLKVWSSTTSNCIGVSPWIRLERQSIAFSASCVAW